MVDIKVGDEVRVFPPRSRRGASAPEGGHRGIVTKVARKYATATYEVTQTWLGREETRPVTVEFDMETGYERGSDSQYGYSVRTPGQVELDRRRSAALTALRDRGIEFKPGREYRITLEQAEALAEVVKTWED